MSQERRPESVKTSGEFERIDEAAAAVRVRCGDEVPDVAIVLGSGLGGFAEAGVRGGLSSWLLVLAVWLARYPPPPTTRARARRTR